jgi:hypothetical protein
MTDQHPITPPPPHLLKKFSAQAQAEANKRNGTGYLKTVATLCIEWFVNSQSTSNDRQIRSSEIQPPRELVDQWFDASVLEGAITYDEFNFANLAAQWGADQELEACCEWLAYEGYEHEHLALRAARRPKPPSLKKQALKELRQLPIDPELGVCASALDTIRRALESLDD